MRGVLTVTNVTAKGAVIASGAEHARTFWRRFLGLMGRPGLPTDGGLLISGDSSIHTFLMRFPIDVVYLDREGRVLRRDSRMGPGRIGPLVRGCAHVLELAPGRLDEVPVEVGDQLTWS